MDINPRENESVVLVERTRASLSYVALGVGVLALGLAVIPGIAMDQPLPILDDSEERKESQAARWTFSFNDVSFSIGGEKTDDEEETEAERARRIRRGFDLSAAGLAICGMVLGPVSWAREKRRALSGSAMGICVLALVWQYVVIGIALGVAVAVLLIVLGHLSV